MFSNYLKIAWRNLKKTKLFTIINMLGIATGMAACLFILHYVNFERSYDQFHSKKDRIYRLRYERTSEDGSTVRFASCCPPAGARIREQLADVEKLSRLFKTRAVVAYGENRFTEERIFFSEPQFFEIFDFNVIRGNPGQILNVPDKALISRGIAEKYFGSADPVGKLLRLDNKYNYEVAGLIEDMPANSHIKMDIVLPWKNLEDQYGPEYYEAWGHSGSFTYLLLQEGVDPKSFKKQVAALVEKEIGAAWREYNITVELPLQSLSDIHLTSNFLQEFEANGNRVTVNILGFIALFIIIIAWVNYINLSTARSLTRAREVGLRKVVGAVRRQIIAQFFLETLILNLIALFIALTGIQLLWPGFATLTGMPVEFSIWQQNWFWTVLSLLFAGGVILSGAYPVIALSSFQPLSVLRGKIGNASKGINLRRALVSFQFVMALILIIGTFAIMKQVSFLQDQNVGFEREQILVVKTPRVKDENFVEKIATFKKMLMNQAGIEQVCVATEVPGRQIYWDAGGIMKAGEENKSKNYYIVGVDEDFVDLFDLQLVAGRSFSREFGDESKNLMFNEAAVRWMGFESAEAAVGQQVNYWGEIYTLVGVLKDYHQQSPKSEYEPQIFRYAPHGRGTLGQFAVKIAGDDIKASVNMVSKQYASLFPGNPFDFFFLDDYYDQQYQADVKFGRVFGFFALLAIFVTSLGILGLAAFMATQRTKEIGIRKVLGAGVRQILSMLLGDFMKLILLAFVIAVPLIYLAVREWLGTFASRFEIDGSLFILPLLLVVLITILTVAGHVLRAALANPIKALRYE